MPLALFEYMCSSHGCLFKLETSPLFKVASRNGEINHWIENVGIRKGQCLSLDWSCWIYFDIHVSMSGRCYLYITFLCCLFDIVLCHSNSFVIADHDTTSTIRCITTKSLFAWLLRWYDRNQISTINIYVKQKWPRIDSWKAIIHHL